MIVDATNNLTLVSTRKFIDIKYIDSGDTIVLSLVAADGKEVAVLIPLSVAKDVLKALEPCRLAEPSRYSNGL